MALFKIFKGTADALGKVPSQNSQDTRYAHEGFAYFTTDDGKFYIDIAGSTSNNNTDAVSTYGNNNRNRIPISAEKADRDNIGNLIRENYASSLSLDTTNNYLLLKSNDNKNLSSINTAVTNTLSIDSDTAHSGSVNLITSGAVHAAIQESGGTFYGVCNNNADVATRTVSISGITELKDGLSIRVLMVHGLGTSTPTLNLNNYGPKSIKINDSTSAQVGQWKDNEVIDLVYDGTSQVWRIVNEGIATVNYYGMVKLDNGTDSTSTDLAATAYSVSQKQNKILVDGLLEGDGTGTITAASILDGTLLNIDTTVISGSDHLITGGAVYSFLQNIDTLPNQTGHSGEFLKSVNGTAEWAPVDALPSQTGHNGEFLKSNNGTAEWATIDTFPSQTGKASQVLTTDGTNVSWASTTIPYAQVDSTSTSTAYTATVPGITELKDGVCMLLKNGVVTSEAGFTININGLGAKPVYNNMAAASAETTLFNSSYTILFIYDSTRVTGGCWIYYRGYNSNTNTLLRTYKATNNIELPILLRNSTASQTAANASISTYHDSYGAIAGTNSPTINPYTGVLTANSPSFTGTPVAPTATAGTNTTQIATTAFVMNAFNANDAMIFKGTLGATNGSVSSLPTNNYQAGWTYRVADAGTYAGDYCEVGDLIIAIQDGPTSGSSVTNAHWAKIEHNIDGAVYMGHAGSSIGSSTQPVYIASNGLATAITGSIANNTTGSAATLTTGRTLKVALGSTSASTAFNGSANITDIGVSGTLGIGNGGTGKTTWDIYKIVYASAANTLGQLGHASSTSYLLKSGSSSAAPSWIQYTNSNTASTIVQRDANGNFAGGTITATTFTGNLNKKLDLKYDGTESTTNVSFNNSADVTFSLAGFVRGVDDSTVVTPSSSYLPLTGGTMTGSLIANASTSSSQVRNITYSTNAPTASDGSVGDIWIVYIA